MTHPTRNTSRVCEKIAGYPRLAREALRRREYAFVRPWVAEAIYAVVAMLWIVPDRRIARTLRE
jgi:hypothetical protein